MLGAFLVIRSIRALRLILFNIFLLPGGKGAFGIRTAAVKLLTAPGSFNDHIAGAARTFNPDFLQDISGIFAFGI